MKKIILAAFVVVMSVAISNAQEFGVGGVHRGGTSPVMKQRMKERIKQELKLTEDQLNAVVTIQQDYKLKARAVNIDTKTSDQEKKDLIKPIEEERRQKLKAVLTDEQITQLDEFTKSRDKMRGPRPGGRA